MKTLKLSLIAIIVTVSLASCGQRVTSKITVLERLQADKAEVDELYHAITIPTVAEINFHNAQVYSIDSAINADLNKRMVADINRK